MERQEFQEATQHLIESYQINLQLGRLDGICFVGLDLGQLLCDARQTDEGRIILTRSRDGFIQLGRADLVQHAQALLDSRSTLSHPPETALVRPRPVLIIGCEIAAYRTGRWDGRHS